MDFFELYEIPPTLTPDAAAVKRKYLELSRTHHPDRAPTGDAGAQVAALEMTAAVNEGFRKLGNPDRTLAYVLRRHGVLEDEEKYTLPPAFLMAMMELNEAVEEGADRAAAVAPFLADWDAGYAPLAAAYDAAAGAPDAALLEKLKEAYFRKKYLLRVRG